MILNGIFEILSVTEELLIIQDQSRAGFGIFGNSRVLKSYRKRSNLGHSVPERQGILPLWPPYFKLLQFSD